MDVGSGGESLMVEVLLKFDDFCPAVSKEVGQSLGGFGGLVEFAGGQEALEVLEGGVDV